MKQRVVCIFFLNWLLMATEARAQFSFLVPRLERDSSYVKTYPGFLVGRAYVTQKFTSFGIGANSLAPVLRYRPNNRLNMGLGLTYRIFTINAGFGFPGLNGDGSQRGKTRALDLQTSVYGRRWLFDIFGQFYKGYYVAAKGMVPGTPGYYVNPDLNVHLVGASSYYVFNAHKFSYRATVVQDEWQQKSAGTLLMGFNTFYGVVNDDNYIVPDELTHLYPQRYVERLRFLSFGPGIGYAYQFVWRKHWYAMGSVTGNATVDIAREVSLGTVRDRISLSPNFGILASAGYNTDAWSIGVSALNNGLNVMGAAGNNPYVMRTGNYKLTFARRLSPGGRTRKILQPVDYILEP